MKKQLKILVMFIIMVALMILFEGNVNARSYYIDEMNIEATILENGDVEVEQTLEYSFNGSYNGIYITIPTQYKNNEEVISKIDDSIYNAQSVVLKEVSQVESSNEINYKKVDRAYNGNDGVFIEEKTSKEYKLKIFSPSADENKTFKVKYLLKNLCVQHNDVGELYYNFIGGAWECTIKNLEIDMFLPYNDKEIKIWGHGPDNGISKIISNSHVKLEVDNVATGKYVAARLVFDKANIPNATKITNIDAYNLIYSDEQEIAKISDAKKGQTRKIYIFGIILIMYWIVLLLKYENDKKYMVIAIEEDELLKKYNPIVAGCLQGSRDILARDIIAVILNLIDKKCIELQIQSSLELNETYNYLIKKVPDREQQMDEIEKYVYNWVFAGNQVVDLAETLKILPKDKDANKKFKALNKMVQEKLNKRGANKQAVPEILRVFNTMLFIIAIVIAVKDVFYHGFEIYNNSDTFIVLLIQILIVFLPVAMVILYLPLQLIVFIRQKVMNLLHKINGQRISTTAVTIILILFVIITLTLVLGNRGNRYIIADEILVGAALLIMLTDNLMLKNSANMIIDYSRINSLKDKIDNYTLMEDRDIEQVVLWGRYLSYAVSFGIADKITKRIKGLSIDDDILDLINNAKIGEYVLSDYQLFYEYASLSSRFMKQYKKSIGKVAKSYGRIMSGSGRRWRRILRRWWLFWRRWKWPEAVAHSRYKIKNSEVYNFRVIFLSL